MLPTIRSGWGGAVTVKLTAVKLLVWLPSPFWFQLSAATYSVCCPTLRPAVLKPPPSDCDAPAVSALVMP